jgi:hypothetical protein
MDGFGDWAALSTCYLRGDQDGATWHLPSMTTSLSGMVQRGLDNARGVMDASRAWALTWPPPSLSL